MPPTFTPAKKLAPSSANRQIDMHACKKATCRLWSHAPGLSGDHVDGCVCGDDGCWVLLRVLERARKEVCACVQFVSGMLVRGKQSGGLRQRLRACGDRTVSATD